jgi:hypothetical protein
VGSRFKNKEGVPDMKCISCGAVTSFGTIVDYNNKVA